MMRNSGALVASKRHKSIYMENVETPGDRPGGLSYCYCATTGIDTALLTKDSCATVTAV